ncbi:hypothetical protein P4O66_016208 [Electrophorus voltai]|uniref:Translation initiation factor 3 N-terminal domain-containing protein n=1 Tax=Electrophorus voltai TaxID=2609070 RepID=A0AAD9DPA3_9TELE|nr:translation initiation factor IF-3, mitochondrial [Electrophorus electricus]KAK1787729.1 hypothetical protein P4O66_016208 [Electrophorus voltai]
MSLGCLRLALAHAVRGICRSRSAVALLLLSRPQAYRPLWGQLGVTFPVSTMVDGNEEFTESALQKKKKNQNKKARVTISSVGRKIHHRHLQLLSEQGENLGTMHRADALRLLDEKGLKLISVNEHTDPPVYQLMSGKQIHEEQMRLREKERAKAGGPVQVKELTLSSDIALHDLDTKLLQMANWLGKKHHVKLMLKARGGGTALDTVLGEMVQRLQVPVGFVSKPKTIQDGRAATCVLRPATTKELQQQGAQQGAQTPAEAPKPSPDQQPPSMSQLDQSKD